MLTELGLLESAGRDEGAIVVSFIDAGDRDMVGEVAPLDVVEDDMDEDGVVEVLADAGRVPGGALAGGISEVRM